MQMLCFVLFFFQMYHLETCVLITDNELIQPEFTIWSLWFCLPQTVLSTSAQMEFRLVWLIHKIIFLCTVILLHHTQSTIFSCFVSIYIEGILNVSTFPQDLGIVHCCNCMKQDSGILHSGYFSNWPLSTEIVNCIWLRIDFEDRIIPDQSVHANFEAVLHLTLILYDITSEHVVTL